MKKKIRVLLFARSFLAIYYSDIKSEIIEPIFVTLTSDEKKFLEGKGWKVYGCFEEEYESIPVKSQIPGYYLQTSFATDRFLHRFSYPKRMEVLGKEISFWEYIFNETKPEALFNETVAVEIAEVMAIEARKRSIPFYSALLGYIPNTFYWKPDPFTGSLNDLSTITPTEEDYKVADAYIESVINKHNKPFYISKARVGNLKFSKVIKSTVGDINRYCQVKLHGSHSKNFKYEDYTEFYFQTFKEFINSIKCKYDSIDYVADKDYLFYPMHLEPEATLNYFVKENYSQPTVIDLIAKSLKVGQYLVVKEHPQHPGKLLTRPYQELRKKHSNLVYLKSSVPSSLVNEKASALVTLTSTAAWEAIIIGKPVFVLGTIFFDQCSEVVKIPTLSDLKKYLREEYRQPNPDKVRLFAAQFASQFKKGCPTPCAIDTGLSNYVHEMENIVLELKHERKY